MMMDAQKKRYRIANRTVVGLAEVTDRL